MRIRATALTAALVLAIAAGAQAAAPGDAPRVRGLGDAATALVTDAQQQSATVRDLVAKLDGTDIVVYVNVTPLPKNGPEAAIGFVGASKVERFVLVRVSNDASRARQLELLGHELQHATEIAAAAWVTSDAGVSSLLAAVGWRDAGASRGYETAAATRIQQKVHQEVRGVTGSAR